jgi:hypothetical protein
MKILLSYTRTIFWTVGVITVIVGLTIVASAVSHLAKRPVYAVVELCFSLLPTGTGAVTCLAARALRRQGRFARTLVAVASVYTLILFPFGTVAGAAGLYWCFSPKVRALEPLAQDFDLQSKKGDGTSQWVQRAVSVISIAIMLGSLYAARWWGEKHGLPRHSAINGLVLIVLCEWIMAFFHEMGHAIAGRMAGMRLASFGVGPFVARKRGGRWKFGFTPEYLLGLGGSAATVPLHLQDLRRRMAVEIAGGPIASFLTAIFAMAVLSMMPGSSWVMWWKIPAVVTALSAGAVVLNLIPFRSAGGYSDGAVLVQLLFGGPFADKREAAKMVGTTTVTSTRPRDLDPAAMSRAAAASTGGRETVTFQMLRLICAFDRGDLALARTCLDSVLEIFPSAEKLNDPAQSAEISFYIAYLDGHARLAGQWLRDTETLAAKKKCKLADKFDYWVSVAAVRLAEGLDGYAEEAWQRAKELADRRPRFGLYEYERDQLAAVKEKGWLRPPDVTQSEALLSA